MFLGKDSHGEWRYFYLFIYSTSPQQGTFPHHQYRDNCWHLIVPGRSNSERRSRESVFLIIFPLNSRGNVFSSSGAGFDSFSFSSCVIHTGTLSPLWVSSWETSPLSWTLGLVLACALPEDAWVTPDGQQQGCPAAFQLDWLWPFTTSIGTSWYAPSQPCCPCPSLEGPLENVQEFAEDAAGTVGDACSEQSRALGFTCHAATETRIPGGCRSDVSWTLRAESTAVCSIPTACALGLHGRKVPARLHMSCASLSPALRHSGSPCQRGWMGHAPKSLLNLRARGDIPRRLLGWTGGARAPSTTGSNGSGSGHAGHVPALCEMCAVTTNVPGDHWVVADSTCWPWSHLSGKTLQPQPPLHPGHRTAHGVIEP